MWDFLTTYFIIHSRGIILTIVILLICGIIIASMNFMLSSASMESGEYKTELMVKEVAQEVVEHVIEDKTGVKVDLNGKDLF